MKAFYKETKEILRELRRKRDILRRDELDQIVRLSKVNKQLSRIEHDVKMEIHNPERKKEFPNEAARVLGVNDRLYNDPVYQDLKRNQEDAELSLKGVIVNLKRNRDLIYDHKEDLKGIELFLNNQ